MAAVSSSQYRMSWRRMARQAATALFSIVDLLGGHGEGLSVGALAGGSCALEVAGRSGFINVFLKFMTASGD